MDSMLRSIRKFLYPCLTPLELKKALQSLEDIYHNAEKGFEHIFDREWDRIADDYLDMRITATKINEKHLQVSSKWSKYVGFNPGLMPAITRWYTESEELKRRIFKAQERNKQYNFELEQYRRWDARSWHSLPGPSYVFAHENPFRYRSAVAVHSSSEGTQTTNTIQRRPLSSRPDEIISGVNSSRALGGVAAWARQTYPNDGAASNVTM
ncbi:hypothetical protein V5O48_013770 [Marasmius crinis-equi]|uniref:Uncharacterized protein n=1 Tax=Marasmius crinis-equi TaxID=585013 RepID=A0ABR3EZ67_9AGAR